MKSEAEKWRFSQRGRCYEAFDLGMGDWTDEQEEMSIQPPPPKKSLRLSLGKEARPLRDTTNLRFAEPASTAELENAAEGPSSSTESVPSDLLMSHDADLMYAVSCISRFQLICQSLSAFV